MNTLGNFKKILKMFGFDGEYPADHPRGKFWQLKNRKKTAVKHSREKPILLNFVNLTIIPCPRLFSTANATID